MDSCEIFDPISNEVNILGFFAWNKNIKCFLHVGSLVKLEYYLGYQVSKEDQNASNFLSNCDFC